MSARVSMSSPEKPACSGRHVFQRADHGAELRGERFVGEPARGGLGHAEVDDLRDGPAVDDRHQDVGRLEVAVDEPLLMGVLDGLADRGEELEALADAHLRFVAEPGQRQPVDQFHDEERPAFGRHAAIDHPGDVGMLHDGQGLPLLFEALEHGLGVHARLDQLERHLALDRLGLLGDPDVAHAAFADLLDERVPAGDHSSQPHRWVVVGGPGDGARGFRGVVACGRT